MTILEYLACGVILFFVIFIPWLIIDVCIIIAIGADEVNDNLEPFVLWTIFLPIALIGQVWRLWLKLKFKKHSK